MNKSSQDEMIERRKDMISYHQSGIKVKDWVSIVAKEHTVSEDAIRKDWGKRREWMKHFVNINDIKKLGWEILQDYELTLIDAINLYEQTEDPKTKIQLLWLRTKINKQKYDFMQETGFLGYLRREIHYEVEDLNDQLYIDKNIEEKELKKEKKREQEALDKILNRGSFF